MENELTSRLCDIAADILKVANESKDWVKVVQCKDCVNKGEEKVDQYLDMGVYFCPRIEKHVCDCGYCSFGERRSE